MDNFVYGLTKKQTSPTSPIGFKSKTDPQGAIDQPVNAMKKLVASGATFVARTHAGQVNHMIQMIERAMDHPGFSVIECLSECVEFFPGAFDPANPRKGGAFAVIEEKKYDNTPEDEAATTSPTSSPPTSWRRSLSPASLASSTKTIARPRTRSRRNGSTARARSLATRATSIFCRRLSTG